MGCVRSGSARSRCAALGRDLRATAEKPECLLGWKRRPIEETIAETAESLLDRGAARSDRRRGASRRR
jgi:hypothetical protein